MTRLSMARTGSGCGRERRWSGSAGRYGASCAGLHPELFDKKHPNPWDDFTLKSRTKTKKHAVTREEVYKFAWGCIKEGRPEPAAVAVICLNGYSGPRTLWLDF